MTEAEEIAAMARVHHAADLLCAARDDLVRQRNPGTGGHMRGTWRAYNPARFRPVRRGVDLTEGGASQFAKWDEERRAMKEAAATDRRGQTLSMAAASEAAERGMSMAPGAVEAARIPAKIGMMAKRPMGGAARRAWGLRSAEKGLRRSGWLKGPRIVKENRGRRRGRGRGGAFTEKLIRWRLLKRGRKIGPGVLAKAYRRAKRARDTKTMCQVAMVRRLLKSRRGRGKKRRSRSRNPLPRWVHKGSIRTIFRGKGKKRRRLLVGCPKKAWSRGRCRVGMRLVEKKRA